MNLSRAVSHLKMQLGLYAISLPFKDDITGETTPTENVIRDVLTTVTIPIYSQFQPWIREMDVSLAQLPVVDRHNNIYMLPKMLTTTPIITVHDVSLPIFGTRGTYGDQSFPSHGLYGARGLGGAAQIAASGMASMMLAGQMRSEPTFQYLGENKVQLYGFPKTILTFKVSAEHTENGESIPESCYDSFMQLAALDMKMFLYNTLKLYDGIATAFGNINLKIDEYQGADSERTSLLDRWTDLFHLDMSWEQFM